MDVYAKASWDHQIFAPKTCDHFRIRDTRCCKFWGNVVTKVSRVFVVPNDKISGQKVFFVF